MKFIAEEFVALPDKIEETLDYCINSVRRDLNEELQNLKAMKTPFFLQYAGKIRILANKFKSYPKRLNEINEETIKKWLVQFELYDKIENSDEKKYLALTLLDHVEFFDSEEVNKMNRKYWDELTEDKKHKAVITVFGKPGSSSAKVTSNFLATCKLNDKLLKDIPEKQKGTLREAIKDIRNSDRYILFIDDIIGSGTQSVRILKEWLGLNKGPLKEIDRAEQLTQEEKEILKTKKIELLVYLALDDGLSQLETFLKQEGFNMTIHPYKRRPLEKVFDPDKSKIFRNTSELEKTKEMVSEIGYHLLENEAHRKQWTDQERKLHSLGFGDYQQLIVFEHGPPKITLPIFWKKGTYQGQTWEPLFPRPEEI